MSAVSRMCEFLSPTFAHPERFVTSMMMMSVTVKSSHGKRLGTAKNNARKTGIIKEINPLQFQIRPLNTTFITGALFVCFCFFFNKKEVAGGYCRR